MFNIQKVLVSNYLLPKVKKEYTNEAKKIIEDVFKAKKENILSLDFINLKKNEFLKYAKEEFIEELSKTFDEYLSKYKIS